MKLRLLALLLLPSAAAAGGKSYSHQEYFEHYEGTKTCLECHEKEAKAFFHSQHYQWRGDAPQIVNADGERLGKLNTINDFCTSPGASWIGIVKNSRGDVLSKGCSKCHAGLGRLPEEKVSGKQLENIDCLICHASGYRRDLYGDEHEGYEWKPILWKNQEGLDSVSKRISGPKRVMCLRCHSGSGGGPNFKRGDLEYELKDCDPEFDVHMASEGQNMQCVECHAGEDHRVRGRGVNLSGSDMPGDRLTCSGCHGDEPHEARVLNHHTARVYCTSCHITEFAKQDATDMARDWSKPFYHEDKDKYSATITLEKNVRPVYTWYNGKTSAQLPGKPIKRMPGGQVGMMLPQGSREDPEARIYAFKLHKGRLPVLEGKQWLVPILVEEFFADGDIDKAVKGAAHKTYGVKDARFSWVDTVRYMGLFHEVQPAEQALECLDCHGSDGRLDWSELGYEDDPLEALLAAKQD